MDAIRAAKTVKTFVTASAVGYYGDRGAEPLTESSAPASDFLAELCVESEAIAATLAPSGVRVVMLRVGLVMHPEGGALQFVRVIGAPSPAVVVEEPAVEPARG